MSGITVEYDEKLDGRPKLNQILPGVLVTGCPGHPGSFYIKLGKSKLCEGVRLEWPKGCSVLLNVKTGTLRAISAEAPCTPLRGDLRVCEDKNPENWRRLCPSE